MNQEDLKLHAIASMATRQQRQRQLPKEMINEILTRVPGSGVLRLRYVCKEWYGIAAEPFFVKAHCQRQIENQSNHRVLFAYRCFRASKNKIFYSMWCSETTSEEFAYRVKNTFRNFELVGSCNGLVCTWYDKKMFYLCNPTTKQCLLLPTNYDYHRNGFNRFGFGFDESTYDYKLVKIRHSYIEDYIALDKVSVYSLRSDSWRSLSLSNGGFPPLIALPNKAVTVDGRLHWLAITNDDYNLPLTVVILCFNMALEQFSMMRLSDGMDRDRDWVRRKYMDVLEGCLSMVRVLGGGECEVWVMKEYGAVESWSRLYVIEKNGLWLEGIFLGFTGHGERMVWKRNTKRDNLFFDTFSYDPKTKTVEGVMDWVDKCDMVPCVESLVSVHSEFNID